jgi:hypothetical protein
VQVQRRLPPNQVEALVADYHAGRSVSELAAQYRLHRTTAHDHSKRSGIGRQQWVRKLSGAQIQEAAQLYAGGLSLSTVGEKFKVDAATVRRAFTQAGVPVRARRGWLPPMA